MPQLDFNITFSQLLWLILIFFSTYTALTHFFLPIFIKLVRARKLIILANEVELIGLQTKLNQKQAIFEQLLHNNFDRIRVLIEKNFFSLLDVSPRTDLLLLNKKIAFTLYYNVLYHDTIILNSIYIKPKFLSLKI